MENLELELEKNRQTEIVEPYKLPAGWKWCKQSEVCKLVDGEKIADKEYPYLEVKYLRGTKEKSFVTSGKLIKKGTKVILVDGENSGEVFAIHEDGYMGSTFKALSIENVDENYLQYFITTKKDLYRNNKKGSAIPHLNKDLFKNMPFPLPPTLAEQHRIVNRIESMFAKLDQAQEKAQSVLDSFETHKAAILHKAFTGQLKIDNEELSIEDWEEKKLGEVCESIFDGDHMPPPKAESGIPFLVISNVNTGFLSFDNTRYVPNDYYDSLSETRKPKTGDVLYTIVGSYGIPVLVDSDRAFCFQRHMALLKPSKLISSRYLWYVLQSNEMYQKATLIATGTAQLTVPIKGLRELTIPVPPLNYQLSIVNFLDSILEKESRAKEAAQTVLNQIALLKKSILARAFRGEL